MARRQQRAVTGVGNGRFMMRNGVDTSGNSRKRPHSHHPLGLAKQKQHNQHSQPPTIFGAIHFMIRLSLKGIKAGLVQLVERRSSKSETPVQFRQPA